MSCGRLLDVIRVAVFVVVAAFYFETTAVSCRADERSHVWFSDVKPQNLCRLCWIAYSPLS